ncbi:Scr1 family TA system antitoxin-like transcriptional regulator [Streptomyces sp. NPDC056500]|uniref:Scr1 family TA system antitoxin-like transcriptional regulator n=1 Tax=Streptomyces sp. NPDC056500 TaxID=3345840 RepID=UPI00369D08CF
MSSDGIRSGCPAAGSGASGAAAGREQLEYVIQQADRPGVTVRVIPFTCEDFIEATQPVLYAEGVVPQLDWVQADSAFGTHFLGSEAELKKYRMLLNAARSVALAPDESRQLIHHIAREL